ncbi:MAG: cardiolipin synthase [Tepidisphaeraceae bacterium]
MLDSLSHVTFAAALHILLIAVLIPWVLVVTRDSTAAVAWCLVVILMPFIGAVLFWIFGHGHMRGPLSRILEHQSRYRSLHPRRQHGTDHGETWNDLGELAARVGASQVCGGNRVAAFHDTNDAFAALRDAIERARHHVHLEFFIIHCDQAGRETISLLAKKAREGVEVRLLFDAMGSHSLKRRDLSPLVEAGGKVSAFFPLNPLRSHLKVNLRNHRKIVVIDGRIGFTGGMNIGDEYLGRSTYFGYWRDSFVRVEGPAVLGLQRIFAEDWDFTADQALEAEPYFPQAPPAGDSMVQIIQSGPDESINSIRQLCLAAATSARQRLWMSSPYFVPDGGLLDALRLACLRGVDVRLLCIHKPDHYVSYFASRYYWADLLSAGAKVYQYTKGMMHAKLLMADGQWGMISSANLDIRSLHLNFEVGCILHTPGDVADLEQAFQNDLKNAIFLEPAHFAARRFPTRLAENACRLFTPLA